MMHANKKLLHFFGNNYGKLQSNPLCLPEASSTTADAFGGDAAVIVAARGDGEGSADAFEGVVKCAANATSNVKKRRVPLLAIPPISH